MCQRERHVGRNDRLTLRAQERSKRVDCQIIRARAGIRRLTTVAAPIGLRWRALCAFRI